MAKSLFLNPKFSAPTDYLVHGVVRVYNNLKNDILVDFERRAFAGLGDSPEAETMRLTIKDRPGDDPLITVSLKPTVDKAKSDKIAFIFEFFRVYNDYVSAILEMLDEGISIQEEVHPLAAENYAEWRAEVKQGLHGLIVLTRVLATAMARGTLKPAHLTTFEIGGDSPTAFDDMIDDMGIRDCLGETTEPRTYYFERPNSVLVQSFWEHARKTRNARISDQAQPEAESESLEGLTNETPKGPEDVVMMDGSTLKLTLSDSVKVLTKDTPPVEEESVGMSYYGRLAQSMASGPLPIHFGQAPGETQ